MKIYVWPNLKIPGYNGVAMAAADSFQEALARVMGDFRESLWVNKVPREMLGNVTIFDPYEHPCVMIQLFKQGQEE